MELPALSPTDSLSPNITINNSDQVGRKKKLAWAGELGIHCMAGWLFYIMFITMGEVNHGHESSWQNNAFALLATLLGKS